MNIAEKAQEALNYGFQAIANQFDLPSNFPPQVVSEIESITQGVKVGIPDLLSGRRDATKIPFVTLDPASSTDLDQAFRNVTTVKSDQHFSVRMEQVVSSLNKCLIVRSRFVPRRRKDFCLRLAPLRLRHRERSRRWIVPQSLHFFAS